MRTSWLRHTYRLGACLTCVSFPSTSCRPLRKQRICLKQSNDEIFELLGGREREMHTAGLSIHRCCSPKHKTRSYARVYVYSPCIVYSAPRHATEYPYNQDSTSMRSIFKSEVCSSSYSSKTPPHSHLASHQQQDPPSSLPRQALPSSHPSRQRP